MTGKNWKSTIGNLAPVLLFLLVVLMFYPYPETFQADSDEGVNLMKASMMHKGYGLYTDIWSDQPPLLTFAIRVLMDLFGARVWLIRTFILLISALMFFAFYQLLTLRWGPAYAAAGAVILFFHPSYVTLSTSIMVGLPSIAFVFISFFVSISGIETAATRHWSCQQPRWPFLSVSNCSPVLWASSSLSGC